MILNTFAFLFYVSSFAIGIAAHDTSAHTTPSSPTCITVTSTNGGSCPTPTPCTTANCLFLSSVTQYCGCPSIYTQRVCESTCIATCGTSYRTLYIPCATSFSSPTSSSTSSTITSSGSTSTSVSETQNTSSSTYISTGTESSYSPTTTTTPPYLYPNTTTTTITVTSTPNVTTVVITSTSLLTLTSCPAEVACHGQTSTWTGNQGPFPCSTTKTCSCVLPGGGSTTVYGTTSESGTLIVEGTSTTTGKGVATESATVVVANGAGAVERRRGGEGWIVGFVGLVLGVL